MKHERIWAPWRLEFIKGGAPEPEPGELAGLLPDADPECFLCRAAPDGDDRRRLVVQRGALAVTVINRYPYNNGHLLVAPKRHVGRLDGLTLDEQSELAVTITRMVGRLEELLGAEDFNIGLNLGLAAGAGLPGHLHWHIVPRWSGDTNFMPVLAGIRVIPQSLDSLWELLNAAR
ncbi:MAG: HIT domain-containing protein [Thermoguttaceae bacterium]|nr:HIT domain-containing protein [Thermoguttaceae bacterium]